MKRKRPRSLDPDEETLWQRVAQTATPLKRRPSSQNSAPSFGSESKTKSGDGSDSEPFDVGAKLETALPKTVPKSGGIPLSEKQHIKMDRKTFQRMKRGKSTPEAKLDLHGMTAAAAQSALTPFILSAQADGKRLVLVITGKGRGHEDSGPIPVRPGVLRQQVPIWLGAPPLKSAVLQVAQAHQRHGGSGAYYVYLRRR